MKEGPGGARGPELGNEGDWWLGETAGQGRDCWALTNCCRPLLDAHLVWVLLSCAAARLSLSRSTAQSPPLQFLWGNSPLPPAPPPESSICMPLLHPRPPELLQVSVGPLHPSPAVALALCAVGRHSCWRECGEEGAEVSGSVGGHALGRAGVRECWCAVGRAGRLAGTWAHTF